MVEVDATSRDILRALSEDCRRSASSLAKEVHCAPKTLKKKLARLENEYEIRYTLELDARELGFSAPYFVLVKFSKPIDETLLQQALKQYPFAQFAALTKGDFDLVVYVLAKNALDFVRWSNYFRQTLSEYIEHWEGGLVTGHWFGFFPLNEDILEYADLDERDRIMLRVLLRNAKIPISDLARRMNVPVSTMQYHLKKLFAMKAVRRATIVMEKGPYPVHYVGLYGYKMTKKFMRHGLSIRSFLTTEGTYEPVNRLLFEFNVAATTFDDVTVYSSTDLDEGHDFHKKMLELCGPELRDHKSAFILKVVKGSLPVRKLDMKRGYQAKGVHIYDYIEKD